MSLSESHDQEKMEIVIVPSLTKPVTTYPQPTNPESSETQIKDENEEGDKRKLLPTDSSLSVPPFPYSFRSEEPTPSESAPSSPRPPPQPPHHVQTHILQSPPDDDDDGADPTHPVLKIADKQELGKAVIVLAVPMVMGLVTTNDSFAKTIEMKVVAVTLCFAFAFISNGILLRRTYRRTSAVVLMIGIALMMLSLYAYLGCILPIYLKWVPVTCWVLSVFPLVTVFVAFICSRMKKKKAKVASKERDLEKGEA